ncbi:MAG: hypothetical protein ACJ74F_33985 [Mycobacterium sp.]|uniref:hypothetical protein n=1 Tax=Mycobacterium sp. TaxID=1785 RepID=UPI00389AD568
MSNTLRVKGTELRYLLTTYLFDHGPATVAELVDALTYHGFGVGGRPSKAVSDALRWEMTHGRVHRLGRGRYGPVSMPRGTEHRISQRVLALHARVAEMSRRAGHEGYSPDFPAA